MNVDESFKIAVDLHTKGKIGDAKNIYENILKVKPDHLLALGNLGIVFSQLKQFEKAVGLFNKVVALNPKYPEGYNNLGNALYELSEYDKSLNSYKKAIQLDPNFSDAFNNIGNIYFIKREYKKAADSYNEAISIGLTVNKEKPYFNLGNIYRELEDFEKSIEYYNKAIEINPNFADAHINLSISLNKNGNLNEAINSCKKVIDKDPKNTRALNNLGEYYQEIGNESLSIANYEKAIRVNPKNLRSRWLLMNTFPIIYQDSNQIKEYRIHFEKRLSELEKLIDANDIFEKDNILNALYSSTNFYLHYLGEDITDLQKRYGKLVTKLTKKIYPQHHNTVSKKNNSKLIKIGFVSSFFFNHVISKLFKNWIIKLNNDKFEKFIYHVGSKNDEITNLIKEKSSYFYNETNLDAVIKKIVSDELDILVFLDIGMIPKLQILGSLRLAPSQCCAYGVPVTTGLNNIDYFLSSKIMETDLSKSHYSEKLICLPDLGVDYEIPESQSANNLENTSKNEETIFLSLQSNFKLLPQHDHIYTDIIKKNPKCKFWFIGTKNELVAAKFKNRLLKMCSDKGLSLKDYFTFYPQSTYKNYLDLIIKSDVILDSLEWSGLNTSLEAISLNKPIITLPSKQMRSRHTYGVLKILNIDELICASKKDYVDLAVKLSTNSMFYENISKKIKINKKLLFNNFKTIEFLEDFFESLFKDK